MKFHACLAALLLAPASALASADFVIHANGAAFSDTSPAAPVGRNNARTVGAQRLAAVKYAASIWSKLLDSPVPIVVEVQFSDLGCGEDDRGIKLASARPAGAMAGLTPTGVNIQHAVPSALANRLSGMDLDPLEPDILLSINSAIDERCKRMTGPWYYGLDGAPGDANDLVDVLLHELAHGLGFLSLVDDDTGALPRFRDDSEEVSLLDAFTAHLTDVRTGRPWSELTDAERLRSANTPRNVVWTGPNVRAAVERHLTSGHPRLTFDPPVPGFSNMVGDAGFGARLTGGGVQGPLYLLPGTRACTAPPEVAGHVVAFEVGVGPCTSRQEAEALQRAGAIGVVVALPQSAGDAPLSFAESTRGPLGIPGVTIAGTDAIQLGAAQRGLPLRARISADMSQYAGADPSGRPYLYTNHPAQQGSNVSHFETLARPDLLMEPASRLKSSHDVDLTRALLADLGWTKTCGNGKLDPGEQCDEGAANSDLPEARCHTTCKPSSCGDGLVSSGEACDEGPLNSDMLANTCRSSCQLPRCGDGVVDEGEACDGTECMPDCKAVPSKVSDQATGKIEDWPEFEPEGHDDDGCSLAAPTRRGGFGGLFTLVLLGLLASRRLISRRR